jgi:heme/copper-type cytochrome/quinol oxidase subunit 2
MSIFKKLKIFKYLNIFLSFLLFVEFAYVDTVTEIDLDISILIISFLVAVISFVIYCHWLYTSYQIYIGQNIQEDDKKPIVGKPIYAVLLTLIPIAGIVLLSRFSTDIFYNTNKPTKQMINDNIVFNSLWIFLVFGLSSRLGVFRAFLNVPSLLPLFLLTLFLPALQYICIRSQEKNIELLIPKNL